MAHLVRIATLPSAHLHHPLPPLQAQSHSEVSLPPLSTGLSLVCLICPFPLPTTLQTEGCLHPPAHNRLESVLCLLTPLLSPLPSVQLKWQYPCSVSDVPGWQWTDRTPGARGHHSPGTKTGKTSDRYHTRKDRPFVHHPHLFPLSFLPPHLLPGGQSV